MQRPDLLTSSFRQIAEYAHEVLRKQGAPSLAGSVYMDKFLGKQPQCAYQSKDGQRCAIGHLLSNEQIVKYGQTIATSTRLLKQVYPDKDIDVGRLVFLRLLQQAHDDAAKGDFLNELDMNMKILYFFADNPDHPDLLKGIALRDLRKQYEA